MSNYFNTLPLRVQLEELGKCRFMEPEEFSDGVEAIKGKKIVIVGCGAQGLNQGLNLRDSGLDVSYALREAAITEQRSNGCDVGLGVNRHDDVGLTLPCLGFGVNDPGIEQTAGKTPLGE